MNAIFELTAFNSPPSHSSLHSYYARVDTLFVIKLAFLGERCKFDRWGVARTDGPDDGRTAPYVEWIGTRRVCLVYTRVSLSYHLHMASR